MEPMHLLLFFGGLAVGFVVAQVLALKTGEERHDPPPVELPEDPTCKDGVVTVPCSLPADEENLEFVEYRYEVSEVTPVNPTYPDPDTTQSAGNTCPMQITVGDVIKEGYIILWARFHTHSTAAVVTKFTCTSPPPPPPMSPPS